MRLSERLVRGFGPWGDVWVRSGWRVQRHSGNGRARLLDPAGARIVAGTEEECRAVAERRAPRAGRRPAAVLLHGILNGRGIMLPMAAALEQAGWTVANVGYASTRLNLAAHAAAASSVARALAEDGAPEISFVGHSLGGLVASAAMQLAPGQGWQAGRAVLVGTPVKGSAIARTFSNLPGYKNFLGPCGDAVTPAGAAGVPPPACRGVAVIAGGTGGRGFNPLLGGDNDFTVTVEETRLPEAGFLLVRAMHNPLVRHRRTIAASLAFLETGGMKEGLLDRKKARYVRIVSAPETFSSTRVGHQDGG